MYPFQTKKGIVSVYNKLHDWLLYTSFLLSFYRIKKYIKLYMG